MHCAEYTDLVAAHVDGELTAEEVPLALAHVADCARCAGLLEIQRQLRQMLRARNWTRQTPDDLRRRVLAAVDAEARGPAAHGRLGQWWARPRYRLALAGAVAALAVLVALPLLRSGPREPAAAMFDTIVADYHAAEAETAQLGLRTEEPDELRAYYRRGGAITFNNSVLDLEALGYILVGGSVIDLGTMKSTMTVYRSARGLLLCHRILAPDLKYPPGGEIMGGDAFYTVGGVTICMHREGDVICFMASTMPPIEFMKHVMLGKA
jgi:anti-sigma factor RsiW